MPEREHRGSCTGQQWAWGQSADHRCWGDMACLHGSKHGFVVIPQLFLVRAMCRASHVSKKTGLSVQACGAGTGAPAGDGGLQLVP